MNDRKWMEEKKKTQELIWECGRAFHMWFPVPVNSPAADHLCGLGGHNLSTWMDTQSHLDGHTVYLTIKKRRGQGTNLRGSNTGMFCDCLGIQCKHGPSTDYLKPSSGCCYPGHKSKILFVALWLTTKGLQGFWCFTGLNKKCRCHASVSHFSGSHIWVTNSESPVKIL